jgi:hypothetical protein
MAANGRRSCSGAKILYLGGRAGHGDHRVGATYYMSSTTMHLSPGLPIMKSQGSGELGTRELCL